PREAAMVLPALCRLDAGGGRERALRPLLVQPVRGRAGDGVLHGRTDGALPRRGAAVREDARQRRHPPLQVLALDRARDADEAVPRPPPRSPEALETVAGRHGGAAALRRLYGGTQP